MTKQITQDDILDLLRQINESGRTVSYCYDLMMHRPTKDNEPPYESYSTRASIWHKEDTCQQIIFYEKSFEELYKRLTEWINSAGGLI